MLRRRRRTTSTQADKQTGQKYATHVHLSVSDEPDLGSTGKRTVVGGVSQLR